MGQKVNPHVIRLGTVYSWSSRWFDERAYKDSVLEDYGLRTMLMVRLKSAGVAAVEIERSINSLRIIIHVSRPGIVIGRGGTGLEELKKEIIAFFNSSKPVPDRKSTRLNSSHQIISYAVFCLKKKKKT